MKHWTWATISKSKRNFRIYLSYVSYDTHTTSMAEIFHNKFKILMCRLQHRQLRPVIMASEVKLFDNFVEICTCEMPEKTAHSVRIWERKYANNVALNELYYVSFITEFSHFPSNSYVAKIVFLSPCVFCERKARLQKKNWHTYYSYKIW